MGKIIIQFKIKVKKPRGVMPPRTKVIQDPKKIADKRACRGLNKKVLLEN